MSMLSKGHRYTSKTTLLKPQDRLQLLYKKQELAQEKIQNKRLQLQEEEMQECTFKPNLSLSKSSRNISHSRQEANIVDRLYEKDPYKFKDELK